MDNEESPSFANLPAEVLLYIFTSLQNLDKEFSYSWIAVTRVCWRWRLVALDSPCLWNRLSSWVSLPLAKLGVKRSLRVPLDVYISHYALCYSNPPLTRVDLLVLEQMDRIRSIVTNRPIPADATHLFRKPAPKLEHFTDISMFTDPEAFNPHFQVPETVLPQPSQLISVTLSLAGSVRFPWKTFTSHNLTDLKVGCLRPPDVEGLVFLLYRVPNLRHFALFLSRRFFGVEAQRPTASLPFLQTVSLEGHPFDLGCILSTLSFPSRTSVTLKLSAVNTDTHLLLPSLQQSGRCTMDKISAFAFIHQSQSFRTVIGHKDDDSEEPKLSISSKTNPFDILTVTPRDLESLTISCVNCDGCQLFDCLDDFPRITELSIRGSALFEFISRCKKTVFDRKTFNNLRRLNIWITRPSHLLTQSDMNMLNEAIFDLAAVLRKWDEAGLRLQELYVYEEGLPTVTNDDGVQALNFFKGKYEKVVERVVWPDQTFEYAYESEIEYPEISQCCNPLIR